MANLSDLPREVIANICGSLTRNDTIALRHTDQQLATKTQDHFNDAFNSIVVTCSKAGLQRLEKSTADDYASKHLLAKVKNVTLHILTPYRLKELAESFQPSRVQFPCVYLRAFSYMRKTLVSGLNALANLENITITQLPFNNTPDPTVDWQGTTLFDPLRSAYGTPPATQDPLPLPLPQVYSLESALSILNDLNCRQTLTLSLILSLSARGIILEYTPRIHSNPHLANEQLLRAYTHIFGALGINFSPTETITHFTTNIHITGAMPPGSNHLSGLQDVIRAASATSLWSVTLQAITPASMIRLGNGFFAFRRQSTRIQCLAIVDVELPKIPLRLFLSQYPGLGLEVLEFRRCVAEPEVWAGVVKDAGLAGTLEEVILRECEVDLRARGAGVEELGGDHWVGREEVERELGAMESRMRVMSLMPLVAGGDE